MKRTGTMRDESGVALPLALLGLVSVSLLVTTAMLTSSTEYAISAAHQDAARALYVAEGGLQAYVAQHGTALGDYAGQGKLRYQPAGASAAEAVEVEVMSLARTVLPDRSVLRVYSVSAEPVEGGGRRVMSMVRQVYPAPNPLGMNLTSALTLGSSLNVNGNAFSVSGRSTACGSSGVEAARLAAEAAIQVNNPAHMQNFTGVNNLGQNVSGQLAIEYTAMTRRQLTADVLQGKTLDDIITQLPDSVLYGPRFAPVGSPRRVWNGTVPDPPGVRVVDANGGRVNVSGGTGLLIVVNGGIAMEGNNVFQGVIITEGAFRLRGNARVEGALVSLAYDAENEIELNTEGEISGTVAVQYDKCKTDEAAMGFGELIQEEQAPAVHATFSWLEVLG